MTLNQNPRSTKRFAVIGYTGSKRRFKKIKSDLLFSNTEWNYNREWEKSKYLDNISVLPTSILIFDKFVNGAQPEVAGEIVGRRHILRTLKYWEFFLNAFATLYCQITHIHCNNLLSYKHYCLILLIDWCLTLSLAVFQPVLFYTIILPHCVSLTNCSRLSLKK